MPHEYFFYLDSDGEGPGYKMSRQAPRATTRDHFLVFLCRRPSSGLDFSSRILSRATRRLSHDDDKIGPKFFRLSIMKLYMFFVNDLFLWGG